MADSIITDDMRALVGTWQGAPHVGGEVHVEDIRKFATSVGDYNPLWLDEDYARGTRWGGVIAPPTFVDRFTPFYVLDDDNNQGYLSGPTPIEVPFRHGFSAGDETEAFRPVRPGDVIVATTTISDLFEKVGQHSTGRMLFVRYDKTYRNQRDDIVSICRWTSVKYEGPVNGDQQPADSQAPAYTPPTPDMSSLTSMSEREEHWYTPVYFEDATEGLELAPVSRLQTQKRFVRWAQASNDLSDIHYDYQLMMGRDLPDVVGQGALSLGYIVAMLSDWYAPNGFLKKVSVQYRRYSVPGDVLTAKAVVTGTRQEGQENLVDLNVWAENQDGVRVTLGQATISLPSNQTDAWSGFGFSIAEETSE